MEGSKRCSSCSLTTTIDCNVYLNNLVRTKNSSIVQQYLGLDPPLGDINITSIHQFINSRIASFTNDASNSLSWVNCPAYNNYDITIKAFIDVTALCILIFRDVINTYTGLHVWFYNVTRGYNSQYHTGVWDAHPQAIIDILPSSWYFSGVLYSVSLELLFLGFMIVNEFCCFFLYILDEILWNILLVLK